MNIGFTVTDALGVAADGTVHVMTGSPKSLRGPPPPPSKQTASFEDGSVRKRFEIPFVMYVDAHFDADGRLARDSMPALVVRRQGDSKYGFGLSQDQSAMFVLGLLREIEEEAAKRVAVP